MPRAVISRNAWADICTLPNSDTCDVSISRTLVSRLPLSLTVNSSADLPRYAPCSCAYSGKASCRAGSNRRTLRPSWSAVWRSNVVSSGRQMPTSEQRGHFGLSSKGGGITPDSPIRRMLRSNSRVRSTSVSSNGTDTRRREPMKYRIPPSLA